MKLLTITNETQGTRSNDFCFAELNELAKFGSTCSRATPDDKCGCARSMVGIDTAKASTTVKVSEVDITLEDLTTKLANNYIEKWLMTPKEAMKMATDEAKDLINLADNFPLNTVLEIRGNKIQSR